jgi:hypothetical protein
VIKTLNQVTDCNKSFYSLLSLIYFGDFLINIFAIAMLTLNDFFNNFTNQTETALPGIFAAIIIIIIGVAIGWFVGKIVNRVINKTVESHFDKSEVGKVFKTSGFDLSNFVGGITEAFIIIISIIIATGVLNLPGNAGTFLQAIAAYLPRLLGGILIIVLGLVLVDFLASLVGRVLKPMFISKPEIADMLKNLLFIGLIAVILNIAFDLMLLSSGSLVYSLILGFVIIGAGIILTDGLLKSIQEDHKEFNEVAGYAKFVLYSIFLLIGTGAIFSTFSGVTGIISTVAWGFAIAFAIVLIPIVYALAKRMQSGTK